MISMRCALGLLLTVVGTVMPGACMPPPPPPSESDPVALAHPDGTPETVHVDLDSSEPFMLDGRDSFAQDGGSLTYRWRQTGGASADLDDATSPTPIVTFDRVDVYTFELVVNDGEADSGADTIAVRVVDVDVTNIILVLPEAPFESFPIGSEATLQFVFLYSGLHANTELHLQLFAARLDPNDESPIRVSAVQDYQIGSENAPNAELQVIETARQIELLGLEETNPIFGNLFFLAESGETGAGLVGGEITFTPPELPGGYDEIIMEIIGFKPDPGDGSDGVIRIAPLDELPTLRFAVSPAS